MVSDCFHSSRVCHGVRLLSVFRGVPWCPTAFSLPGCAMVSDCFQSSRVCHGVRLLSVFQGVPWCPTAFRFLTAGTRIRSLLITCEFCDGLSVGGISILGKTRFSSVSIIPPILHNHLHLNPLNPELNPICCLLALLGAHHFLHVSRIRVKSLTFRRLMSNIYIYIYIWSTHS